MEPGQPPAPLLDVFDLDDQDEENEAVHGDAAAGSEEVDDEDPWTPRRPGAAEEFDQEDASVPAAAGAAPQKGPKGKGKRAAASAAAFMQRLQSRGGGAAGGAAAVLDRVDRKRGGKAQAVTTPAPPRAKAYPPLPISALPAAALAHLSGFIGTQSPVYAVRSVDKISHKGRKSRVLLWVTPLYLVMTDSGGRPRRVVRLEDIAQMDLDDVRSRALLTPEPKAWDRQWMWEWLPDPRAPRASSAPPPPAAPGSGMLCWKQPPPVAVPPEREGFIGALQYARRAVLPEGTEEDYSKGRELALDWTRLAVLPQGLKYDESLGMRPAEEKLRRWTVPTREEFKALVRTAQAEAAEAELRVAQSAATMDLDAFQRMARTLRQQDRHDQALAACVLAAAAAVPHAVIARRVGDAAIYLSGLRSKHDQLVQHLSELTQLRNTVRAEQEALCDYVLSDAEWAAGLTGRRRGAPGASPGGCASPASPERRAAAAAQALRRQWEPRRSLGRQQRWGRGAHGRSPPRAGPCSPAAAARGDAGSEGSQSSRSGIHSQRSASPRPAAASAPPWAAAGPAPLGERPLSPQRARPHHADAFSAGVPAAPSAASGAASPPRGERFVLAPPGWLGAGEPGTGRRVQHGTLFTGRRLRKNAEKAAQAAVGEALRVAGIAPVAVEWLGDGRAAVTAPPGTPLPTAASAAAAAGCRFWRHGEAAEVELDAPLIPELGWGLSHVGADGVGGLPGQSPRGPTARSRAAASRAVYVEQISDSATAAAAASLQRDQALRQRGYIRKGAALRQSLRELAIARVLLAARIPHGGVAEGVFGQCAVQPPDAQQLQDWEARETGLGSHWAAAVAQAVEGRGWKALVPYRDARTAAT
eukprot:TRINITY_DN8328_c0_g1_i1.p1 TRINITY_DN8328_c0_g1~~TRINITY_DN8328_c0_g1_i1.p1  ORF type:complete len:891 (+),score=167.78 TRINITY_DN8328_c0_g1_i1:69-2675(+)